jgi:peptidoglycan/LPS O-acetylase OafA/YrhL
MQYRPEVDGLRAVAVLPVLLFHAVPALVPGGYLGVDVFFVISGFLITGLLLDDLEAGRFSLLRFYERRARRILPALLVVIAVTLILAWALMLPRGFAVTARSAAAAAAFLSNVFFWQTTDYFDVDSIAQPLLHTWSLAVEEQFYILFPLLLAGLWRWVSSRVMLWVVGALLLCSLALAEWGSGAHAKVNYFFTFSRFWEMLLGAVGAFVMRGGRVAPNGVAAAAGLVAIVAAMALFSPATPHPGVWTLIPTLGALAVLIWARPGGLVATALSLRPVVGIGKISYSLYLWHFPVFSFAVAQGPVSAEPWNIAAQIALTFGLSVISWRWVETPFRSVRAGQGPARALWMAGVVLVVTIALGQGLAAVSQMTLRYLAANPEERAMLTYAETMPKRPASAHLCFMAVPRGLDQIARCLPEGSRPS